MAYLENNQNGIKLAQAFNISAQTPIDDRLILSKEDMDLVGTTTSATSPYNLGKWPEHYFVLCIDDRQIYEFHKDSAAPNGCVFTRLTRKIDNKTIRENANLEAYIKIDGKTIQYDSEAGLHAIPEALIDGVATHAHYVGDSERVDVLFDEQTLELLTALNKLAVKYDHDTIKVGSEGLFTDFAAHVDDFTIKYNSEGKLVAQYEADEEKGLHLDGVKFEVKVDDNFVKFNSEGELTATFLRYVGSEGIDVVGNRIISLPDNKTIKVVGGKLETQFHGAVDADADGLFVLADQHTIKTSEGARPLRVPLQDLIHSSSEAVLALDKSVADELTLKIRHDDTLVETSEGLHVVARQAVASEGIIVQPVGETSIISVDFDHKTLVLGSEGLEVNIWPKHGLKLATGAGGALGLKADIDEVTINYNSEGKLVASSTPLLTVKPLTHTTAADGTITLKLLYDDETIKLDASEGIYVPIDEDTIIVSEGLIKAKKQLNADGLTIVEFTSEGLQKIKANIDNATIIVGSEGEFAGKITTAIGGWKEAATHKDYIDSTVSVTPGATFVRRTGTNIFTATVPFPLIEKPLDRATADLFVALKAGTGTVLSTLDSVVLSNYGGVFKASAGLSHELINFEYDTVNHTVSLELDVDTLTANNIPLVDTIEITMDGMATGYHTIDANYVPIDNDSIIIRNGVLVTAAPSITAGDGLEYVITPTANILNVLTDSETVDIAGDHLYVPVLSGHTPAEEDLVLTINSEGKPEFLKRAGVVDVVLDGESLVENYVATIPLATDSEYGAVKFDNDTIILNSENQLQVVRLTEDVLVKELVGNSEVEVSVVDSERAAHIDLTPYSKLNETGYRIRLLVDNSEAASEGVYTSESQYIITAELYDQDGNLLTTSNPIDLPMEHAIAKVGYRLLPPDSEGIRETVLIFTDLAEKVYEVPLGTMSGFVRQHADYLPGSPNGSISGNWDFSNELYNHGWEVVTQLQFDEASITFDTSENYVRVLPYTTSEGIEIIAKPVTKTNKAGDTWTATEYIIGAKFDHETIKLNAADELKVNLDEKTLVYNATKDWIEVPHDSETVVLNSEGKFAVPIDKVTIFVNSEGLLEAAGMDVKPGDAISITTSEEGGLPVKYLDVLFDSETIMLDAQNRLYVPIDKDSIIINSENLLEVDQYTVAQIKDLWHQICLEGEA